MGARAGMPRLARRAARLRTTALIPLLVTRMPARSGGLPSAAGLPWSAFAFQGNSSPLSARVKSGGAERLQVMMISTYRAGTHYPQVAVHSTKNAANRR
jgi:hypothetical protein